jgi:Hydrazine synthase alpha subunit middle domain
VPARFMVILGLALAAGAGFEARVVFSSSPNSPPLIYSVAKQYNPTAWIQGGERFPLGATLYIRDATSRRPLIPGFAASADPSVSFDGKRVLFAGKQKARDPWQIWEIAVETGGRRQITHCPEGCVRPFYVPEDRVVYGQKTHRNFVIEIAPLSGGAALPLTYSPGSFLPTDVLRDGRVLLEAAYPLGGSVSPELYTVYPDGSGVESYRCDHGHARYAGRQVASGDIVFARERGLGRFTSALAHEVIIPAPQGIYAGDVVETPAGDWLLAWRAGSARPFELGRWRPGASALHTELAEKGVNVVQPALLMERPVPNRYPSGLHDWSYANVLCLNAYTSKYRFTDGAIASVRLYTRDASGGLKLLGTSTVEHDGSFYLRVPGDQPLRIELLDKSGKLLKQEAGWFWLRRGEQRVCVGCHAGPETAPENAVPAVLQRSTIPSDMTGAGHTAAGGGH